MNRRFAIEGLKLNLAAILWSLLLVSCRGEEAQKQEPALRPATAESGSPRGVDAGSRARAASGESAARKRLEQDARLLLSSWEAAQNKGDFSAYERLYAEHFTGVKRSGPRTRNFARAGWLEDRKRMFEKPMQVRFELKNVSLQSATASALGSQFFRSGNYEDRGDKAFTFAYEDGSLRIVREEMLGSELTEPPSISARMVVDILDGPLLVIVGRASDATPRGERVSVHAAMPAALVETASVASAPGDAQAFLAGDVQLVGPTSACTTRAKAVRIAHVGYAHFGQVGIWRGEDPRFPKPSTDDLASQIHELDPHGFWAIELESRCVKDPLVAVPGAGPITVYEQSELPVEGSALSERFAKLPSVRALPKNERALALSDLTLTRFSAGKHQLVAAEAISGCSAPVVRALFDMERGGKLGFASDKGRLEHVEAVADLDGDGAPEIIARSAIGADTWGITDFTGKPRVLLKLPYYDCPC